MTGARRAGDATAMETFHMRFFRVIGAIVLAGLVLALGVWVYQAGVAAGAAGNAPAVGAAYPWYGYGSGFGFGLFHLFGFLLVVVLIAVVLRALFWGGRMHRGWGPRGDWRGGPGWSGWSGTNGDWEQRIREYHDRLHGGEPPASGPPTQPGSGA